MNIRRPSRPPVPGARVWALLAGALIAVGLLGFTATTASAATRVAAETRVEAFSPAAGVIVGPSTDVSAAQRRVQPVPHAHLVVATGVAANKGPATLFHYTDEAGQRGILESGTLNPSLKSVSPKDARYGDGQYLTDIAPGTKTCAQLSACLLGIPFQGRKFTHYVEIDVSGLNVVKGREGVFVNRSGDPLDISRRLISGGMN